MNLALTVSLASRLVEEVVLVLSVVRHEPGTK
jgi:hypothetical protein